LFLGGKPMIAVTIRVMCDYCDNEDTGMETRWNQKEFVSPMSSHSKWLQLERKGWTFTGSIRCPECQPRLNLCGTHPDYVCSGTSPIFQHRCLGYERSENPEHKYCKWNYSFHQCASGVVSDTCFNEKVRKMPLKTRKKA